MMNRNYFKAVWTAEECKERFKELVKELHPDNNPDRDTTREFQDMNAEFIKVYEELKNVHRRKSDGQTYEETREAYKAQDNGEEFAKVFTTLFNLDGLTLQISGSWLWIFGDTYANKEVLKDLGCKYSGGHKAWYYTSTELTKKRRRTTDMSKIVEKYGAETYKSEGTKRIA